MGAEGIDSWRLGRHVWLRPRSVSAGTLSNRGVHGINLNVAMENWSSPHQLSDSVHISVHICATTAAGGEREREWYILLHGWRTNTHSTMKIRYPKYTFSNVPHAYSSTHVCLIPFQTTCTHILFSYATVCFSRYLSCLRSGSKHLLAFRVEIWRQLFLACSLNRTFSITILLLENGIFVSLSRYYVTVLIYRWVNLSVGKIRPEPCTRYSSRSWSTSVPCAFWILDSSTLCSRSNCSSIVLLQDSCRLIFTPDTHDKYINDGRRAS